MSVETFNLTDTINVTPAAAKHFSEQLGRSGGKAVRITLKESGCSGFMYAIEEVPDVVDGDIAKSLENGVLVCFRPADAVALRGSQIDYTKEGLNQTLKIDNPNVTDACGCGASFNIDLDKAGAQ
ncbi:MAG TPA: iron-sulfur cluster assembly accessory protein [Pseudomonadales bacterium]|nr:iron-sulfur cluster assembly accessory protein [Pseudomonadales bacterium]